MASSASFYLWNGWLSKGIACKCVCCFCLYLLHFWLDIVFLCIMEGEHLLRLERAVYRDLHDLSATAPRVNLPNLTSIAVCHTSTFLMSHLPTVYDKQRLYVVCNMPKCCVFVEWAHIVCRYISSAKGRWNVFWVTTTQCTLYFCAFASQITVVQTTLLKGLLPYSSALQLWKLLQIQTFILPDFSHHLSKIVIIRFLCFSLLRNKLDYEQITT